MPVNCAKRYQLWGVHKKRGWTLSGEESVLTNLKVVGSIMAGQGWRTEVFRSENNLLDGVVSVSEVSCFALWSTSYAAWLYSV